jgi:hypothetical protein
VLGLWILWRYSRTNHIRWSGKLLLGTVLMGFGMFNLVEGIIDHQILAIHHVNETVLREPWIYWDIGFLVWGAAKLIGGWLLLRAGRRKTADGAAAPRTACRIRIEPSDPWPRRVSIRDDPARCSYAQSYLSRRATWAHAGVAGGVL